MKNQRPTVIYILHHAKLIVRTLLFVTVLVFYILDRAHVLADFRPLPIAVWAFFFAEMLLRFFPSRLESMGCQKQFSRNYLPRTASVRPSHQPARVTLLVAAVWLLLNGVIGAVYLLGRIDVGILVLISLGFSVCDMICILFFCPFQTWLMKNRCCTTCRIYNWDFAMMFTPLVFIPSLYTYSLLGAALLLLLCWEITYYLHPERFSPASNACLDCSRCKERLCNQKRQLRAFLRKYKKKFFEKNEM